MKEKRTDLIWSPEKWKKLLLDFFARTLTCYPQVCSEFPCIDLICIEGYCFVKTFTVVLSSPIRDRKVAISV